MNNENNSVEVSICVTIKQSRQGKTFGGLLIIRTTIRKIYQMVVGISPTSPLLSYRMHGCICRFSLPDRSGHKNVHMREFQEYSPSRGICLRSSIFGMDCPLATEKQSPRRKPPRAVGTLPLDGRPHTRRAGCTDLSSVSFPRNEIKSLPDSHDDTPTAPLVPC